MGDFFAVPKPTRHFVCVSCVRNFKTSKALYLHALKCAASIKDHKPGGRYGIKRVKHAGMSFGSALEASVYDLLCLREKGGEIKEIKCQQHVYLTDARILYIPDFSYLKNSTAFCQRVYVEAKGFETPVWRIKRRLWEAGYGPGPLEVWKGTAAKPFLAETIFSDEASPGH